MRKTLADRLATVIGTGVYAGYFPIFPGTAGSVAGVVLYLILVRSGVLSHGGYIGWVVTLGVVFLAGVASAGRCERLFGPDNKRIVVDEVWGMLISLFALPVTWRWVLAAFVIFRLCDIVKPFPARRAERMGGGLAVMLDDGIAGAYTAVVLHLVSLLRG